MATFGTNSTTHDDIATTVNYMRLTRYEVAEGGTIDKIFHRAGWNGAGNKLRCVIYADDNNYPGDLVWVSDEISLTAASKHWELTGPTGVTFEAGYYWIGYWSGPDGGANYYVGRHATTGGTARRGAATYHATNDPPDPCTAGYTAGTDIMNCYVEYTPAPVAEWREGETHTIRWTEADPLDPDGDDVTYRIEFSAAGDFTDAVLVAAGIVSGTTEYEWTLPTNLVAADTTTCKLRIRAEDHTGAVSAWSTSSAFAVLENAYPTVEIVSPEADEVVAGNEPYVIVAVDDADGDNLHVQVQLSLSPSFASGHNVSSIDTPSVFEEAADPYAVWTEVPTSGATAGNRVRWQPPPLRYDAHYVRARVFDGILWSDWTSARAFTTTPGGDLPLTCTIGDHAYYIKDLVAHEKTGGEPSPLTFRLALSAWKEKPFAEGDQVSVGLALGEHSRAWNGTVETWTESGAWLNVYCLQDDAYLSRKLVTGDLAEDDIGDNLAALVDTYGAPLDSTAMATALGVDAAIEGEDKTLAEHLRRWADILGLILWVDATGSVHLEDPADYDPPEYVLYKEYV